MTLSDLRPVPGHKDIWASKEGEIYSTRSGVLKKRRQHLARDTRRSDSKWYYRITLRVNGYPIGHWVHLLVAEAWLGPRLSGYECHHKDENQMNNRVDNLEWLPHAKHVERHRKEAISDSEWEDIL